MSYKTVIRSAFQQLGLDIHRYVPQVPYNPPPSSIVSLLRKFEIDLVLDVGANAGHFASGIRRGGYTGKIVSFEPLSQAHSELLQSCSWDALWEAYPRCALGDFNGEVEINIAGNSASSSILPMLDAHSSAAPTSVYIGKEKVPIGTLDSVVAPYLQGAQAPFLKIDTQGFEWQVLDGAKESLPHIKGILIELSLLPLYEGQHLWREVIDRLEAAGFTLWAFKPEFTDLNQGRTLQVDGIFFRKN